MKAVRRDLLSASIKNGKLSREQKFPFLDRFRNWAGVTKRCDAQRFDIRTASPLSA